MAFLVPIIASILAGIWAHSLAVRKRRSVGLWVTASVLFGLPVLLLFVLPAKEDEGVLTGGA